MKDLGQMGESTFRLWCADAGLIANPSDIDKTGWDFLVEFPFTSKMSSTDIHKSAQECKVQVKATNKRNRKISITLSNLRRLITAQIPAFLVFIEFDEQASAQSAFVVHIDKSIITDVLKRMHQIKESYKENNFNKRTMTISYDNSHRLEELSGASLRKIFLHYIGDDFADYIAKKKAYLESTGFEEGYAQMTFSVENLDALIKLIDVSLGIVDKASICNVSCVNTRFGIKSKDPLFCSDKGDLAMPEPKPYVAGKIRFKSEDMVLGLLFDVNLYISPFNAMVSDNLKKFRIVSDFFEMIINPYAGKASYSLSFTEEVRLEIKKFRDAMKLANILSLSDQKVFAEMIFDGFPKLKFTLFCKKQGVDYDKELRVLNCMIRIISLFEISDFIDISYYEIMRCEKNALLLCSFFDSAPNSFKVEFDVDNNQFDIKRQMACISIMGARIGKYVFVVLFVMKGSANRIGESRFSLIPCEVVVERKLIFEKDEEIFDEKFRSIVNEIEDKYSDQYTVVSIIDSLK